MKQRVSLIIISLLIFFNVAAILILAVKFGPALTVSVRQAMPNEFGYSAIVARDEQALREAISRGDTSTRPPATFPLPACKTALSDCRQTCHQYWRSNPTFGFQCYADCRTAYQFCQLPPSSH